MSGRFMIYGATGTMGRLIAQASRNIGLEPVLAARKGGDLLTVAAPLDLDARTLPLTNLRTLDETVGSVDLVINAAGPYSETAMTMIDSCFRVGVHYMDLASEVGLFDICAGRNGQALDAGILLMPGCGIDNLAADCLASHLSDRLGNAVKMTIAKSNIGRTSRGAVKSLIEGLKVGAHSRSNGRLQGPKRATIKAFDFGRGGRKAIEVGSGEVFTAYHSANVGDVRVFLEANAQTERLINFSQRYAWLFRKDFMQRMFVSAAEKVGDGPTAEERAHAQMVLYAEASSDGGRMIAGRLHIQNPLEVGAAAIAEMARRTLQGNAPRGYQTAATAFGRDLLLDFPGVWREDMSAQSPGAEGDAGEIVAQ